MIKAYCNRKRKLIKDGKAVYYCFNKRNCLHLFFFIKGGGGNERIKSKDR